MTLCKQQVGVAALVLVTGVWWSMLGMAVAAQPIVAAPNAAVQKIEPLWPAGAPGALGDEEKDKPKLMIYLPKKKNALQPAMVICPGGGYGGLAMGHEGYDIANWLNSQGIAAFICDYRHRGKGYGHPAPLQDAQRAIRTVRSRAKEFAIHPQRIGIIGFSAGGHLVSTTITHFDAGDANANDPIMRISSRPDFAVLCYPVVALGESYTHKGSQRNLLGKDASAELVKKFSSEKQVRSDTPPAFLWHTQADKAVPSENSVQLYLALTRQGIPAELHIYEHGRHGLGLARDKPAVSQWPNRCIDWLRGRGFLSK